MGVRLLVWGIKIEQAEHAPSPTPHAQGQGRWPRRATPHPRSHGCVGAGGPRGASPRSRSGGVALRRYTRPR